MPGRQIKLCLDADRKNFLQFKKQVIFKKIKNFTKVEIMYEKLKKSSRKTVVKSFLNRVNFRKDDCIIAEQKIKIFIGS